MDLSGQVALVTGASRGVGRGVAAALCQSGATVYATGRRIAEDPIPGVRCLACDHTDDQAVAAIFREIELSTKRLDILVNVAWGGYERMVEDGRFTYIAPFWEQPLWRWDAMMTTGVRGAFVASQHAARQMVTAGRGLIVNISFWAAQKYLGNTLYGISKAATDKMTRDMAHELTPRGVTVVSLYPGLVRTEAVLAANVFDLSNSESPEFIGRVIAAMARDPNIANRAGTVCVAAALAQQYDVEDIDGKRPKPLSLADV
ncbi:MAG: SDR family NAD(P)-dependent oxidoreductase [Gemmatimonadaceae bacterium]